MSGSVVATGTGHAVAGTVRRGCLIMVVGPSGAGKDSILDGARRQLAEDDRFVFARREITRPATAGGEEHISVSWEAFRKRAVDGTYELAWEAHGLGYGVPAKTLRTLSLGKSVIVNVSRGILGSARSRFSPVRIVNISVPQCVLAERLRARGRESAEEISRRLERADAYRVDGEDVVGLINDGPLSRSVTSFVQLLSDAAPEKG